ncbi:MAG: PIG-L family deacetylase, partial [Chloroflexi bacterium]|nr:PIG-L family deacetylase [Chloroflexota bacterium]
MKVLAVMAHPDDESCLVGGTLAQYARAGAEITLVIATHGEAGTCQWCQGTALGATRTQELLCAARTLGIARVIWLEGCHDGALMQCDADAMAKRIGGLIRDLKPNVILTLPRTPIDNHPDHRAVGLWTTLAFVNHRAASRVLYFALKREAGHVNPSAVRVDVTNVMEVKLRAVKCHRSQVECWENLHADLTKGLTFEYLFPFSA